MPMKVLLDFLALILFFAVYYTTHNIFAATVVAIIAGIFQAAFVYWKTKKLDTMQLASLGLIVVFGGATLIFRNAIFIQWKPTILYWLIAAFVLFGLISKKNVLQLLMGKELQLPEKVWKNLAIAWCVFFFLMGVINLFVAYTFSEQTWVSYKVFGAMGLMIVFIIGQVVYMAKFLPKESSCR